MSIFRVLSFFPPGCRKGPPPLPLSSAGGGVYLLCISRSTLSLILPLSSAGGACTPLGNNLSPVCGQCYRRFRFTAAVPLPPGMPEGAAAPFALFRPLGNNLSPVCGQYRQRFRFTAAVSLPPGMPEGAAAPSALFRRRGRVPRRGAIFCLSGRNDLPSSSLPSVPKTSAEGKSLLIHKSPCSAIPSTDFYASRQRGCFLFGEFSYRRKPATHTISGSVAIDRIVVAAKISDA